MKRLLHSRPKPQRQPYEYALLLNDQSIRILVLEPGYFAEKLKSRLVEKTLDDLRNKSDPDCSNVFDCHIKVNHDCYVPITKNLDTILRHLRSSKEEKRLWVDSVCINQSPQNEDHAREKGLHVEQMDQVYELAEKVIVWLGLGSYYDWKLFEEMQKINGDKPGEGFVP